MKKVSILTGSLIIGFVGSAYAGGYESNALSTSFMYEAGGEFNAYSEVSYGSRSYDIKGTVYAPTGSAVKDQTSTTISFKYDVTDNITVGFTNYNQGNIQLDYSEAGAAGGLAALLPVVDLTIDARVLLAKYNISENIGVIAGVKQTVVQDASADIFQQVPGGLGGPYAKSEITGDTEIGYVYGVAYTQDEIALRAELTFETSTDFELATTGGNPPAVAASGTTEGSTPDYINLYLQSGIAEDTLLYGSIRTANWSENQIFVYPHGGSATSSFTDSRTYSLGLGRKFTDNFSGSISLSGEPKGASAGTSLLSITNGYQGITLGGKYTINNMSITGGYNYTQLGDKTVTPDGGAAGEFTDNTLTGLGVRVGFKF